MWKLDGRSEASDTAQQGQRAGLGPRNGDLIFGLATGHEIRIRGRRQVSDDFCGRSCEAFVDGGERDMLDRMTKKINALEHSIDAQVTWVMSCRSHSMHYSPTPRYAT